MGTEFDRTLREARALYEFIRGTVEASVHDERATIRSIRAKTLGQLRSTESTDEPDLSVLTDEERQHLDIVEQLHSTHGSLWDLAAVSWRLYGGGITPEITSGLLPEDDEEAFIEAKTVTRIMTPYGGLTGGLDLSEGWRAGFGRPFDSKPLTLPHIVRGAFVRIARARLGCPIGVAVGLLIYKAFHRFRSGGLLWPPPWQVFFNRSWLFPQESKTHLDEEQRSTLLYLLLEELGKQKFALPQDVYDSFRSNRPPPLRFVVLPTNELVPAAHEMSLVEEFPHAMFSPTKHQMLEIMLPEQAEAILLKAGESLTDW